MTRRIEPKRRDIYNHLHATHGLPSPRKMAVILTTPDIRDILRPVWVQILQYQDRKAYPSDNRANERMDGCGERQAPDGMQLPS